MKAEKTELYRHFDKNNTLLYVGVSLSYASRLAQHRDHAHWFQEVDTVKIERFATRRDALDAEKRAVLSENPKCNIQLKKTAAEIARENRRLRAEQSKNESRLNLTGKVVNFSLCYDLKELSGLIGIGSNEINRHINEGNLSFFELDPKIIKGEPAKTRRKMISGWQLISFIEHLENASLKGQIE